MPLRSRRRSRSDRREGSELSGGTALDETERNRIAGPRPVSRGPAVPPIKLRSRVLPGPELFHLTAQPCSKIPNHCPTHRRPTDKRNIPLTCPLLRSLRQHANTAREEPISSAYPFRATVSAGLSPLLDPCGPKHAFRRAKPRGGSPCAKPPCARQRAVS